MCFNAEKRIEMITKKITISDGVRINYIETEKFKSNFIAVNFISELDKDKSFLNSMVPRILSHASKSYPSQAEIDKRLQYLYSASLTTKNISYGQYHIFGFLSDMLNDKYALGTSVTDEMVNFLCDIIFNPYLENGVFSKQFTENEKLEMIDAIEAEINSKTSYSITRCIENMFEGEIFSVRKTGTVEDVERITPEMLYNAYKKALSECTVEIYVVGSVDIDRVASTFKAHFDKVERHVEKIIDITPTVSKRDIKQICEIDDVSQGKLCMGFRLGNTNDTVVANLFSELYGASPTSKLFINVREKKSLCYTCRSILSLKSGAMYVVAGIEATNKEIAEKAILEQLDCVKNAEITDEELESAKKSLKNAYMTIYDRPSALATWFLNRSLSSLDSTPMLEYEKLNSITKEQIASFAKKINLDTVYFMRGELEND